MVSTNSKQFNEAKPACSLGVNMMDGMTMMVVAYEMGLARKVADLVAFMDRGEVVDNRSRDGFFGGEARVGARRFLSKILPH